MKEETRKLQERKKRLLEAIEFTKQKKKQIIGIVQKLASKLSSKTITRHQYDEEIKKALKNRTAEQWIKYYDDYLDYYNYQIKLSDKLIKQEKYGKIKEKIKQKAVPALKISIIFVAIALMFSLVFILKPLGTSVFTKIGEKVSTTINQLIEKGKPAEELVTPVTPYVEPIVPVSLEDKTVLIQEESLTQYPAVVGQPVKWKKQFTTDSVTGFSVELPKGSENVKVKTIEDGKEKDITDITSVSKKRAFLIFGEKAVEVQIKEKEIISLTGSVVGDEVNQDNQEQEFDIGYETPAPVAEEEALGEGKRIIITGPDDVHYKNILSFTELPKELNENELGKFALYQIKNGQRIETQFTAYDTNENGLYDYIEWITPELSEAVFEIVIEDISAGIKAGNIISEDKFTHLEISDNVPYNSLVLYMPFDVNTGTKTYDYTEKNNDGTLIGDAVVNETNCIYGDCLQLDGDLDYINARNDEGLNLQGPLTLSAWVYPVGWESGERYMIIDKGCHGGACPGGQVGGFSFWMGSGTCESQSFYYVIYGGWVEHAPAFSMELNKWQHLAVVYNQSNGGYLNFYKDGVNVRSVLYNETHHLDCGGNVIESIGGGAPFNSDIYDLSIGVRGQNIGVSEENEFNGSIDEVMIFNNSLSDAEILKIYNNQSARFKTTGTQMIKDLNIPLGASNVTITGDYQTLMNSSINLSVGYYTDNWYYTDEQIFNGSNVFNIDSQSTNLSLNFSFFAGNLTNPFYSPILDSNVGPFRVNVSIKGLISHWKFDETTLFNGETAYDSIFGNDGTVSADHNLASNDMFRGSVASYDGWGDYVDIGARNSLHEAYNSEGTLGLWVRPASDWNEVSPYNRNYFFYSSNSYQWFSFYKNWDGNKLTFKIGGVPGEDLSVNIPGGWKEGYWYYFTVVWKNVGSGSSNGEQSIYINGKKIGNKTLQINTLDFWNTMIGGYNGQPSWTLNGSIDDIQVYNVALNESEILDLYKSQLNDSHAPNINFTSPTPARGSTQSENNIFINVSAKDYQTDISTFIDFNRSLVGWWRMDDVNENTIIDKSSYGNNGTAKGNAVQGEGKLGKAMEFDGGGDYVEINNSPSLNITDEITLAVWYKEYNYPTGGNTDFPKLLIKPYYAATSPWEIYSLCFDKYGKYPRFVISNGSTQEEASDNNIVLDLFKWHFVVGTFNGTDLALYINGKLNSTHTTPLNYYIEANNMSVYVATRDSIQDYFNGTIDDVMIFNRALSPEEVRGLYANSSSKYLFHNFENLVNGNYTFKAYAQDAAGNVNLTETREVKVIGTDVTGCRNLDKANTVYTQTANIISGRGNDNCINITAQNITLDCAGKYIDLVDNYAGVYSNQYNTTIKNCNISMGTVVGGYGIYLKGANNSLILNNSLNEQYTGIYLYQGSNNNLTSITAIDNYQNGIYLYLSSNNNTLTNINTSKNRGSGIYLSGSNNNLLSKIIVNNNTFYGLALSGSSNNTLRDSIVSFNSDKDALFIFSSVNNTFLNVTYNISKEYVSSNSQLIRKWYYQANVSSGGYAVSGANLSAYNVTGIPLGWQFNLTSKADGLTDRTEIIDYININNVRNYYSNYTISTTNGSLSESHQLNVTLASNNSGMGKFGGLIFENIVLRILDTTPPYINFTNPTPPDKNITNNNFIPINVSANDSGRGDNNISVFIDFNRSLVGWWRMDDVINIKPLEGCNPDAGKCTEDCGGIFYDNPVSWNYLTNPARVCHNASYSYVYDIGGVDFCEGNRCAFYRDNTGPDWYTYLCPSYEGNGNISVNGAYCECNSNNPVYCSNPYYDYTFNFSNEFFAGLWRVVDKSSYGNNGTISGAVQTDGKLGKAMSFDGSNDYVAVKNPQNLNFGSTTDFTFSAWIKAKPASHYPTIFGRRSLEGNHSGYIFFLVKEIWRNSWNLTVQLNDGGPRNYVSAIGNLQDNNWHYVVASGVRKGYMTFYVDGVPKESVDISNVGNIDSTSNLFIGWEEQSYDISFFNGLIDDVIIFKRALSAEEVAGLYANSSSKYLFRNFENLQSGNYTFKAYAQDTAGNVNWTETREMNVLGTDVTECRDLTEANTVYILTKNIINWVAGRNSCINITAQNITLDCAGKYIYLPTINKAGIYSDSLNTTIKNCNISMGIVGWGIYLEGANNSNIFNSTIFDVGLDYSDFINLYDNNILGDVYIGWSKNSIFKNINSSNVRFDTYHSNNITIKNIYSNYTEFYAEYSNNCSIINLSTEWAGDFFGADNSNNFYFENIFINNSEGFFIRISHGFNNYFKNVKIKDILSGWDIYLYTNSKNNTLLNVTYGDAIDVEQIESGSELIRKWYYQANVTYNNLPVKNANLSAYNITGIPKGWQFNLTSNSTGWTNRTDIIDYINLGGTRNYYSNYTINTTNGSLSESHKLNVTWKTLQSGFGGLILDNINIGGGIPQIIWVQNISNATGLSGELRNVNINFSVYYENGYTNLNDSSAKVNFTRNNFIRNSSCSRTAQWSNNYANYTCNVGMWYYDLGGMWNVSVAIADNLGNWAVNGSSFLYEFLYSFNMTPKYVNWSNIQIGDINKSSDNNITIQNFGNVNIINATINATSLFNTTTISGQSYQDKIPAANFTFTNSSFNPCNSGAGVISLIENQNVSVRLFINYSKSNLYNYANSSLGFCLKGLPSGISAQAYKTETNKPWDINVIFGFFISMKYALLAVAVVVRKRRKIKIPISIFKESIGPAEVLCKYLKENFGLKIGEISKLLNRDETTISINYNNAVKKIKKRIIIKDKLFVDLYIFSDRRLSILESVVKYLKEKGYRNYEIAELLGKDQRNVSNLYLRAEKKIKGKRGKEIKKVEIPLDIFKNGIGGSGILYKYLRENLCLGFKEIARLTKREESTVWMNYRNINKLIKRRIKPQEKMLLSIKIFSDRRLSILESVVKYLKEKGYRNYEIAELLGKDQRNVYTLYNRGMKKLR